MEKLNIKNDDTGETFDVLFNPTEYSVEEANTWKDQERERQKPELQFTGQALRKVTMELFLDTYEKNEDVRIHTGKLSNLMIVTTDDGNNGKRPPKIILSWGTADPNAHNGIFPFLCVLESLRQQFTLFTSDGKPVRAKCSASFKEYLLPADQLNQQPQRNSFPVQTYTIRAGDTLSGIAAAVWKDPLKWRLLADANRIRNPRLLAPGETLVVPAIE